MVNITHKSNTLRQAIATALVKVSSPDTITLINERKIPKGDIFEFSRAAGLLAIKKTSDVIPDCHPLPVEFAVIRFAVENLTIKIEVEVHTIYKTGVEVEAMHGAAITALTMYDMLKPVDKGVEIEHIRLEEKKGGKTDHRSNSVTDIRCAVVVCSDKVSAKKTEDLSGQTIKKKLEAMNLEISSFEIIPDEAERISQLAELHSTDGTDLLIFSGGTGLSPRDITPDVIAPMLDRQIPGVMEAARNYGQQRAPYAMLSRGVCGFIKNTLVLTLPGSVKGVEETMDAVFPYILHVFKIAQGQRHD